MLLLENFIEQIVLCPILIKKNIELEQSLEILVFHQSLIRRLSVVSKKGRKLLSLNGYLRKGKDLQSGIHTQLLTRN